MLFVRPIIVGFYDAASNHRICPASRTNFASHCTSERGPRVGSSRERPRYTSGCTRYVTFACCERIFNSRCTEWCLSWSDHQCTSWSPCNSAAASNLPATPASCNGGTDHNCCEGKKTKGWFGRLPRMSRRCLSLLCLLSAYESCNINSEVFELSQTIHTWNSLIMNERSRWHNFGIF